MRSYWKYYFAISFFHLIWLGNLFTYTHRGLHHSFYLLQVYGHIITYLATPLLVGVPILSKFWLLQTLLLFLFMPLHALEVQKGRGERASQGI